MRAMQLTTARICTSLATVLALAAGLVVAIPTHALAAPPGGRTNFVVSVMFDEAPVNTTSWARVSYLIFDKGLDANNNVISSPGSVLDEYWYWDITNPPAVASSTNGVTKLPDTTAGCPRGNCAVYAQSNFPVSPTLRSGTYAWDSTGTKVKVIYPKSNVWEEFVVSQVSGWALTRLTLDDASYQGGKARGIGYGSNASVAASAGAPNSTIAASPTLYGYDVQAQYQSNTAYNAGVTTYPSAAVPIIRQNDYSACSTSPCMQKVGCGSPCNGANPSPSNLVVDTQRYGRRVMWQYANSNVITTACWQPSTGNTSVPLGHTVSYLQILDDSNNFYGLIGADAVKVAAAANGDWVGINLAVPDSTVTLG